MYRANPKIIDVFQALSDPHRLRIVTLMLLSDTELCLCDLSESLEEPEYKLSRHLKVLKNSGMISSSRSGKWIYHSLVKDKLLKGTYDTIKSSYEFKNSVSLSDLKRLKKRKSLYKNKSCNGLKKTTNSNRLVST